jgi:hypothetical protein
LILGIQAVCLWSKIVSALNLTKFPKTLNIEFLKNIRSQSLPRQKDRFSGQKCHTGPFPHFHGAVHFPKDARRHVGPLLSHHFIA